MKNNLFEDSPKMTAKQKLDNLIGSSYATEEMLYQKPLTEEELSKCKDDLAQTLIKIGMEEEKFEKVKEEFKSKVKPLKLDVSGTIKKIKNRSIEEEGTVYLLDDQENGMMNYYDKDGNLLSSRRLLPEEKQLTLTKQAM